MLTHLYLFSQRFFSPIPALAYILVYSESGVTERLWA